MTLEKAVDNFINGFPSVKIEDAATVSNGGIKQLSENERCEAEAAADGFSGTLCKFVPASGAATRMFKDLYSACEELEECRCREGKRINEILEKDLSQETLLTVRRLVANAAEFPVDMTRGDSGGSLPERGFRMIHEIIDSDKSGLGQRPKGLIPFHKYAVPSSDSSTQSYQRTPFEEHLIEGAMYSKDAGGVVSIEFTVSPEHLEEFRLLFNKVRGRYEKLYGCRYDVSFSVQSSDTDIVAVDMENRPFRKEDGTLLFRPGGHGALLQNLNRITSDFVFIKNIDNVVREERLSEIVIWKKILLGRAVALRNKCAAVLSKLLAERSDDAVGEAEELLMREFCVRLPEVSSEEQLVEMLLSKLNRPVRVCGMVRNEGEPGGGPFICIDKDGSTSLQILESAQIDKSVYSDELARSTHFNPVDLVCSLKNCDGAKFDLMRFADPDAGFISQKSYKGHTIKAQEYPGLWNGSMSDWNTQFIEVPLSTFNPVKTFFDLLRPAHR